MKKRFLRIIRAFFLSVLCFVCFFGCSSQKSEHEIARDLIKGNSKIEVPINSEIIYHLREKSKGFVHGGDFQYTVFKFQTAPTDWLKETSFNKEKSNQFELYFSSALSTLPDELGEIQQEFLPNFDDLYYYLQTEDVYFVYLPKNLLLITIIPSD